MMSLNEELILAYKQAKYVVADSMELRVGQHPYVERDITRHETWLGHREDS